MEAPGLVIDQDMLGFHRVATGYRKSDLHVTAGVVTLRLANFTLRVAPICLTRCCLRKWLRP